MASICLPVEPAAQDHRRGGAVEVLPEYAPPPRAARAAGLELGGRLEGRVALIDQVNGQREAAFELGREAARSRMERALAAVDIIRGTDHQHGGGERTHLVRNVLPVRTATADGGGGQGGGAARQRVTAGDANTFQSEIEGEDNFSPRHALEDGSPSGMARLGAQALDVHAQQAPRARPALL